MTDEDPRETVLRTVAGELRVGPLARRRILTELADHIDDAVDDLRGSGASREEATREAVARLGDAQTIADTFGEVRGRAGGRSRLRVRRSLAWMMVAAMSVVTGLAAELPQASGAKAPAKVFAAGSQALASRSGDAATRRPTETAAAPRHRHSAGRRW